MMSQASANEDANVNPVYEAVVQVKLSEFLQEPDELEMFEGWRNWTLRDNVRILKDMAKLKKCYGMAAVAMGNIVFRKFLEAAADSNVPFKVIEETVLTALKVSVFLKEKSVLSGFKSFEKQAVCDFFKEFVKRGKDYERYYNLIYTMLTHRLSGNFPRGLQ